MLERYAWALPPLQLCAAGMTGPSLCIVSAFLGVAHAQLGQIKEARAAIKAALRIYPNYTVKKIIRAVPNNDPRDVAHLPDGLRKAGLPMA